MQTPIIKNELNAIVDVNPYEKIALMKLKDEGNIIHMTTRHIVSMIYLYKGLYIYYKGLSVHLHPVQLILTFTFTEKHLLAKEHEINSYGSKAHAVSIYCKSA